MLDYLEPAGFTGVTEYVIPLLNATDLDMQWSVQLQEFSDAQIDEWTLEGLLGANGWTVDRDSMMTNFGHLVTATITLHFEKQ